MEVPLVAARFAPLAGGFALDLATGERARLETGEISSEEEHHAWLRRCGALCEVWHPALAECLDFGLLGSGHRFAAFGACRHLLPGRVRQAWPATRRAVNAFLAACGLDVCLQDAPFAAADDRPLAVPYVALRRRPASCETPDAARAAAGFGVRLVSRAVLETLIEHLTLDAPPGLATIRVEAALGSGGRTLLRTCAREARRRGFVPVSTATLRWIESLEAAVCEAWTLTLARHHLLVLHDARRRPFTQMVESWGPLLRMAGRHARTRVVLELTARGGAAASTLRLAPLQERELVEMVVFSDPWRSQAHRLLSAARRARGRPGPFIEAVGRIATSWTRRTARPYTVHEQPTGYGDAPGSAAVAVVQAPAPSRIIPAPGNHDGERAVRDVFQSAARLVRRGRHAAGDRALRQAYAMALRRRLWTAAAEAAASRAELRAVRGDVGTAERLLLAALEHSRRDAPPPMSPALLTRLGVLQLEDGRIEQAEATLRSAAAAASPLEDSSVRLWAAAQLARCLWWQRRHEEARLVLADGGDAGEVLAMRIRPSGALWPCPRTVAVLGACVAACIELSASEHARARTHLIGAANAVEGLDAAARGLVCRVEARWRIAVGDVPAFRAAIDTALRFAADARRPLDRLAAMTGYVEGCLRLGVAGECSGEVRRLEAAARRRLPGLIAFRIRVAIGLHRGSLPPERARAECDARRLQGLAPGPDTAQASPLIARSPMYEDVIEVLGICQEEESIPALTRVLEIVRGRTRAAAVELLAGDGAIAVMLPPGVRAGTAAKRAIESGLPIAPVLTDRGTEAAVPLKFGGSIVGALACRWIGAPAVEGPAVMGLLGAVGAAVAPSLHLVVEQHRAARAASPRDVELIGESAGMQEIRRAVVRAADAPFPVLVQGESGSGKELVARAIHRAGARRGHVFCALNCAALPDDLLEAELFGHARGAFTGAVHERAGLFEEADGGVLFLDEVGELTPRGQAKLLRAIQEGEIKRLGETFARKVDVRIVAATNRPLEQEVAAGRFRRDLRYRLDVIRIAIPPLRERPEDIPLLAQSLWRAAAERVGSRAVLSGSAVAALARYDWPGNVRELQNVLAALAVAAPRRGTIGPAALPATVASAALRASASTLEEARRLFEERYVRAALARSGGHRGRTAAELGVTRQGLAKLMGRLGLSTGAEALEEVGSRTAQPTAGAQNFTRSPPPT